MRIDWKAKLTSRKFWTAIVGFITPLMLVMGASDDAVTKATALVMAGGTLIAYIIGEGLVDAAREGRDEVLHLEPDVLDGEVTENED